MWPRLIAQLIELLPHVSRLVPMADSFFASRASGDRAHTAALGTLGESLRSDQEKLSQSSAALSTQITEQSARIAALQMTLNEARVESVGHSRQIEWLTKDLNALRIWVKFGVATIVLLLAVTLVLVVKLVVAH